MVEFVQVLRAIHILFAIVWGGAAVYRSHVVQKMVDDDDVFATRFFAHSNHGPFMGVTSLGTVLFGLALMGLNSEAYGLDAVGSGAMVLGFGMTFALAAMFLGFFGHLPLDKQLRPLAAKRAAGEAHDEAGYAAMVAKETKMGRISMALIGLALLTMVTFRWFA